MRPIAPRSSVNQRLWSGPRAISRGLLFAVGSANSVTAPAGVIRPIRLPARSANQTFPSGPRAMPHGSLPACGSGCSKTVLNGLTVPILSPPDSVNQTFPSAPSAIPRVTAPGVGTVTPPPSVAALAADGASAAASTTRTPVSRFDPLIAESLLSGRRGRQADGYFCGTGRGRRPGQDSNRRRAWKASDVAGSHPAALDAPGRIRTGGEPGRRATSQVRILPRWTPRAGFEPATYR